MKEPKELPGKKTPKVENPKSNETVPATPVVETPEPPQVKDPSAPPDVERKNPTSPGKRKRIPVKNQAY